MLKIELLKQIVYQVFTYSCFFFCICNVRIALCKFRNITVVPPFLHYTQNENTRDEKMRMCVEIKKKD